MRVVDDDAIARRKEETRGEIEPLRDRIGQARSAPDRSARRARPGAPRSLAAAARIRAANRSAVWSPRRRAKPRAAPCRRLRAAARFRAASRRRAASMSGRVSSAAPNDRLQVDAGVEAGRRRREHQRRRRPPRHKSRAPPCLDDAFGRKPIVGFDDRRFGDIELFGEFAHRGQLGALADRARIDARARTSRHDDADAGRRRGSRRQRRFMREVRSVLDL